MVQDYYGRFRNMPTRFSKPIMDKAYTVEQIMRII